MIREITLPAEAKDMLAGGYEIGRMFQDIQAAYWLHGRDNSSALYLLRHVHETFEAVADALGYTITPKGQPETDATRLRDFIADFAATEFTLAPRSHVKHPADEPDQYVSADEVWAWQEDARDLLAVKEAAE